MTFWVKFIAIIIVISLLIGTGYEIRDYIADADEAKYQQKVTTLEKDLSKAQGEVRIEYVTKVKVVRVKGDTITIRVPEWVDNKIFVNNGFIAHHNAAADNATLGVVPADALEQSNVSLADVETVVSENYTICNENIKQIIGLQDSIKTYQEKQSSFFSK